MHNLEISEEAIKTFALVYLYFMLELFKDTSQGGLAIKTQDI